MFSCLTHEVALTHQLHLISDEVYMHSGYTLLVGAFSNKPHLKDVRGV